MKKRQLRLWPRGYEEGFVVDLFAGGGGASVGIEAALGRPVDVALNHDAIAIATHARNHPHSKHLTKNVWRVRPIDVTGGRPVSLLWASPDCRHFSIAKGGVPRSKKVRSLANAVVRWAKEVRPAVICLENVREFLTWGPLCKRTGNPVKARAGESFLRWRRGLERLGYTVEHRVLDASHYGAPTRRKRLFVVARCDGERISWPEPTHGAGRLPFRTAAECIDWSLPCPSIFERKRPLAEKTMWRIAQGIRRFVLGNPKPFIVRYNTTGNGWRGQGTEEPLTTIDTANRFGIVAPNLVKVNHAKQEARGEPIDGPLSTVTASRRGHGLVAAVLQQSGYGEREGQRARVLDIEAPLGTLVGGQKHAIAAASLVEMNANNAPHGVDEPLGVVTSQHNRFNLVSAFLSKAYGDPLRTEGGGAVIGSELPQPLGTVTARDHHGLAAVTLATFRGTDPSQPGSASVEDPLPTISAGGIHVGEVRAFLTTYYGSDGTGGQKLDEPARTIRTKHCFGLVTVEGVDYQIVDIGFRMLEPHELLRAQFGRYADGYDMSAAKSKAAKVRLIGNSVCPELAEALVRANLPRQTAAAA